MIYLVRHGESIANTGAKTPSAKDTHLTELGKKQAREFADKITQEPDLIVISPYVRTYQTALPLIEKFPNVPTAREIGLDITTANWRGLFAKKGTPPEVLKKLHDAFKEGMNDPEYKKIEAASLLNLRPGYLNSEDFSAFIEEQYSISEKIFKDIGLLK